MPVSDLRLPDPDPSLAPRIIEWYRSNGRSFPWRGDVSAYHILCVEVMLQRTRAEQVRPVFESFASRFDGPSDLVDAGVEVVSEIFAALGLRWRAPYFWALQLALLERHAGGVPRSEQGLLALPGVGHYAATAVRVFRFGERATVVDSNVLRILGRLLALEFPESARRSPRVLRWADEYAPERGCREFNWGLLDLGATICRATPQHSSCPLRQVCATQVGPS